MQYQQPAQHGPLPFFSDRLTSQVMQINVMAPPFLPPNINAAWVTPHTPFVTGLLMDSLGRSAQDGPISTFFFNMMSTNGWNNPQFSQMVQDCEDFILIKNANWVPPPHSIENTLVNGVIEFLNFRKMGCLVEFPQLWGYIRQEDQQGVNATLGQWREIMGNVMHMRQSTPPQGYSVGQPMNYQPQQPMGGAGHGQQVQPHRPYTQAGSAFVAQVTGSPGQGVQIQTGSTGGRSFGGPVPVVQQPAQGQQQYQAPQVQQPVMQPTQPVTTKENTMTMQVETSLPPNMFAAGDVAWKAPKSQPAFAYPPAFNPTTHRLYFDKQSDNSTIPVIKEGTDLSMIDYDRHAVASMFGKPPAGMKVARDAKEIHSQIDAGLTALADEAANATEDSPTVLTKAALLSDTSLESSWAEGRLAMMNVQLSRRINAFRLFTCIYTPIINWEDETEQVKRFATSPTYISLREELKAAGETASPELVSHVNLMMTEHCNHILHRRLSIGSVASGGITVEDFTNDLDALLIALRERYGDAIEKAFLLNQRQEIAGLFRTLDPNVEQDAKMHETLADNLLMDGWETATKRPRFTFIGRLYNLTLIDVLSHDLQLAGVEGVGNALLRQLHPTMYNLAANVLESDNNFGLGVAAHHLVRTKDGRIFEITRGHINNDFMLVSLEK